MAQRLPWRITEASVPDAKADYYITTFDLGIGQHDRVDHHLAAAKRELLTYETDLDSLCEDCTYALWVYYDFPASEGAFNISRSISAAFGFLRVELIFHLNPK